MSENRNPPRTAPTQAVIRALLINPDREMYGVQIKHATGNSSSAVSQILRRLETLGWVTSRVEANPRAGLRDRRYYRLTPLGLEQGTKYASGNR